jgi:hypothetical protein
MMNTQPLKVNASDEAVLFPKMKAEDNMVKRFRIGQKCAISWRKLSRISYKEAAGRKGTREIAGRFIRAGHPAPLQLVLDEGKDLNDFYRLNK